MCFRVLVSLQPAIQATGRLTLAPAGLTPAEHTSLRWTHIRRKCLDHVVIFDEHHLRRTLSSYVQYYHRTRTHLSLDKDCPQTRPISPPTEGKVIALPEIGGLHHRYERRAA
jgi:hypothetical protein